MKAPTQSFHDFTKALRRLTEELQPYQGVLLKSPQFVEAATGIAEYISKNKQGPRFVQCYAAVLESLKSELAGIQITPAVANHVALRLAGNTVYLRAGLPVLPFTGMACTEWVIAVITDVERHVTSKRRIPGAFVSFHVLTGQPADCSFSQFFTANRLQFMAKQLGVRRGRKAPRINPRQLVKCRLLLMLEPGDALQATQYCERASLNTANKALTLARQPESRTCMFSHTWPCWSCDTGFNTCALGCHPEDYIKRQCRNGHDGWFAPQSRRAFCLSCDNRKWKQS